LLDDKIEPMKLEKKELIELLSSRIKVKMGKYDLKKYNNMITTCDKDSKQPYCHGDTIIVTDQQ
jgi:hypothetical protein